AGRPRVKIPNAVFERGAPSYGKIHAVLNFLWGKDRRVTIHNLTKNVFLFYISSTSLRRKVLLHELWRVGNSPFFVTKWKAEFSFNPPTLESAPVWASIRDIPFDLVTEEGLSFICRPLGKVVDVKPFSSIKSAEVKVIVDFTKPLSKELEIERQNGGIDLLRGFYPWLLPFCLACNEYGHGPSLCLRESENQVNSKGKNKAKVSEVIIPPNDPPPFVSNSILPEPQSTETQPMDLSEKNSSPVVAKADFTPHVEAASSDQTSEVPFSKEVSYSSLSAAEKSE
ncbi:hypothetical protein EUTSA_v10027586mg, partial [Eutrema salsugineum]